MHTAALRQVSGDDTALAHTAASASIDAPRRLHYEDCFPGRRVVHETRGPGTIVRTSARLVVVRPDRADADILAFAEQLRPEQ